MSSACFFAMLPFYVFGLLFFRREIVCRFIAGRLDVMRARAGFAHFSKIYCLRA